METSDCLYCPPNAPILPTAREVASDQSSEDFHAGDIVAAHESPHNVARIIYNLIPRNGKRSSAPSYRSRQSAIGTLNSNGGGRGQGRPAVIGLAEYRTNYEVYLMTTYNGLSDYRDVPAFMHKFLVPVYPGNYLGCVRLDDPKFDNPLHDKFHIHTTPEWDAGDHPSGWVIAWPMELDSGRILHRYTHNLQTGVYVKVVPEIYDELVALIYSRANWWRTFCAKLSPEREAELHKLWQEYIVSSIGLSEPSQLLTILPDSLLPRKR